jgi:hypothetical protein
MLTFLQRRLVVLSASLPMFLIGCGGGGGNANVSLPGGGGGNGGAGSSGPVFGSFFGMNQVHLNLCDPTPGAGPFTDAPIGAFRAWDVCKIQWPDLEPSAGAFDFTNLDTVMASASAAGVSDVLMEVGRIPNWISSNPGDTLCDAANVNGELPGLCDPPRDLNPDGTGTDATFIAFAQALLTHAVAQNYPLKYLEIFEEFHRSDSLTGGAVQCFAPSTGIPCSWRGTFAQMLRMTQDLRCIAKGKASDPITANGLTCGTAGYGKTGIMPSLNVSVGNAGPSDFDNGAVVMANFLYCNHNPPPSSVCNYTNSEGSAATDMIGGHAYFGTDIPETVLSAVARQHNLFSTTDQSKPYFIGEGSWGANANLTDAGLQNAYVTRWYLSLWMTKDVKRAYWWAWDASGPQGQAGLWTLFPDPFGNCTTPENNADGGFYCSGGVAYNQTVSWLRNATSVNWTCPDSNCTNQSQGVYTFTITGKNGYQGLVEWNSTAVSSCSRVPCGSTAVPAAPSGFTASQWRDLNGVTHTGAPSAIGASPVIIENMAPASR